MRHWREREFENKLSPQAYRNGLGLWAWFAKRPALYRRASGIAMRVLGAIGRRKGRFRSLPLAKGWTDWRDMPAPEGKTFHQLWAERQAKSTTGSTPGKKAA
jgi:L-lactate dehydrogenase complex protein LldF